MPASPSFSFFASVATFDLCLNTTTNVSERGEMVNFLEAFDQVCFPISLVPESYLSLDRDWARG